MVTTDLLVNLQAAVTDVSWTRHPSVGVTSQDLNVLRFADGTPARVQASGIAIDLVAYLVQPTSYTNDPNAERAWLLSGSAIAAAEEGGIWEQVLGVPGVSAVRVLQVANTQRVPILVIDQTNVNQQLARLQTFPNIAAFIRSLAQAGLIVVVPERNLQIDQWVGIGFAAVDRQTGAAGWFIAGVLPFGFPLGGVTARRTGIFPVRGVKEACFADALVLGLAVPFTAATGADVMAASVIAWRAALLLSPLAAQIIGVGIAVFITGLGAFLIGTSAFLLVTRLEAFRRCQELPG